jgi:hypothetical protein
MKRMACCLLLTLVLLPEGALSQSGRTLAEQRDSSNETKQPNQPKKVSPRIGINIGAGHQRTENDGSEHGETFFELDVTIGLMFRVGQSIKLGGKVSGGAIIEEAAFLFIPVPTKGHALSDIAGVLEFNLNQGSNLGLEIGAAQYTSLQYRPMVGGYLQIQIGKSKINRYLSLSVNYQSPTVTDDESDSERMFLFRLGHVWAF